MKSDNKLMDVVLKIYEKIEQGNEKLETRIASIENKLETNNQILARNDDNLQDHMKRTAQLESLVISHEKYVSNVQFLISVLGVIATVAAIYSSFSS